jgi:hypothetical protein
MKEDIPGDTGDLSDSRSGDGDCTIAEGEVTIGTDCKYNFLLGGVLGGVA